MRRDFKPGHAKKDQGFSFFLAGPGGCARGDLPCACRRV